MGVAQITVDANRAITKNNSSAAESPRHWYRRIMAFQKDYDANLNRLDYSQKAYADREDIRLKGEAAEIDRMADRYGVWRFAVRRSIIGAAAIAGSALGWVGALVFAWGNAHTQVWHSQSAKTLNGIYGYAKELPLLSNILYNTDNTAVQALLLSMVAFGLTLAAGAATWLSGIRREKKYEEAMQTVNWVAREGKQTGKAD